MARNIQFTEQSQIPLAVKLLDYINLENIDFDTGALLLECIAFLIIECGYTFKVIKEGSEINYNYPKAIIIDHGHKDAYAFKIAANFRSYIANKVKIVVFDEKKQQIRTFN